MASTQILFSTGAPRLMTGAPGESTCATSCHNDFPLNSGTGNVSIVSPAEYSPSEQLTITVQVTDPSAVRFGFSITAIDAVGLYVGSWDVSSEAIKFSGGSTDHVTHSAAPFVQAGSAPYEWTVRWTAPANDVGTVTFYAAGNAADGTGSTSGDQIYASSREVLSRGSLATEDTEIPADFVVQSVFPNPFADRVTIVATLNNPADLTLELFDLSGRRLKDISLGVVPSGTHEWIVRGEGLSAGPVIYRLQSARETRSGLLIVSN